MEERNEFVKAINSPEFKACFDEDLPGVFDKAQNVIDWAKEAFSNEIYVASSRQLSLKWKRIDKFYACAAITDRDPNHHEITLSDGTLIEFHLNSEVFPTVCIREFTKPEYGPLWQRNYPEPITPVTVAKNRQKIVDGFFKYSLIWLYLHEQAHLFQCHRALDEGNTLDACHVISTETEQHASEEDNTLTGDEAWLSHAFELSADYEATSLSLQNILVKERTRTAQELDPLSLWTFVAAISCMFHKFYGPTRPYYCEEAEGSHPDPILRMRSVLNCLKGLLNTEEIKKYFKPGYSANDYMKIAHDGYIVADMYMTCTHFQERKNLSFSSRLHSNDPITRKYFSKLSVIWAPVHEKIRSKYFGPGIGQVLPCFSVEESVSGR